jgi:hypothetical protein
MELADRGKEEKVEAEHCDYGRYDGLSEAPGSRNSEDTDQVGETSRGRINVPYLVTDGCGGGNNRNAEELTNDE